MPGDFYFWLDLEMTGLNEKTDRILEAAAIITDKELHPLESYETAVFQTPEVLAAMGAWCQKHHAESGLTARVPGGIREEELDTALVELAGRYLPDKKLILCGNSIGQDRKFVDAFLPRFSERLHYRMLDVTAFKIVFRDMLGIRFEKEQKHRALDDIRESIDELRYYLQFVESNPATA
ncbi:MAG: oligoribonuclease [Verrucomicrobiota bacterium]